MGGQPNGGISWRPESVLGSLLLCLPPSLGEGFGGKPQALTTYPVARSGQEQMTTRVHLRAGQEEKLGPSAGGAVTKAASQKGAAGASGSGSPGAGVEGGALPWPPPARTRSPRQGADEQNPGLLRE